MWDLIKNIFVFSWSYWKNIVSANSYNNSINRPTLGLTKSKQKHNIESFWEYYSYNGNKILFCASRKIGYH